MENQAKINLCNVDTWIRALYMILFGFLSVISRLLILVVSCLQFLSVLWAGVLNKNLQSFGQATSIWTYQAFLFLTYNSDEKPFPFSSWPDVTQAVGDSKVADTEVVEVDDIPIFVEKNDKK